MIGEIRVPFRDDPRDPRPVGIIREIRVPFGMIREIRVPSG